MARPLLTACVLGGVAALAGAADVPARAPLPERLLRVALRCIDEPAPAPAAASGGRVVGTAPGVSTPGALTWRSSAAAATTAPHRELVVANGESADWRWQDEQRRHEIQWAAGLSWRPGGRDEDPRSVAHRTRAGGPALQLGVVGAEVRSTHLNAVQVLPRWPGGRRPVQVTLTVQQSTPADAAAAGPTATAPGRWSLRTTLHAPLDEWVTLARAVQPVAAAASTPPACSLQLRVALAD